ncbi:MAG: hypothetical protein RIT27_68 [Pseudomonadota bacterium]|jgi:hypothetical protein
MRGLFAILLILQGCTIGVKETATEMTAVWANDDSSVAFVLLEKNKYQIYIQIPDNLQSRQPIGDARDLPVKNLFFVKSHDYLVVESTLPSGGSKFDKLSLNGKEITILETKMPAKQLCKDNPPNPPVVAQNIIPSPDGRILASVGSQGCGEVSIDFLQAQDLMTVGNYNLEINQSASATWRNDGFLVLAGNDGKTAWQVLANQAPMSTNYPKCLTPVTTSSTIAADGRRALVSAENISVEFGDKSTAFGCQ